MAATEPQFSVVIPLYNKRRFIGATLATVLGQTLGPQEVLVVDDGSSDGGDALVEAMDDPRIAVLRQANAGPGAARNTGAARACGAWIAFVDADDLWAADHLERLAEVIAAHPEADLVSTAYSPASAGAPPPLPAGPHPSRALDFLAPHRADPIFPSSVAVRRTTLLDAGGFAPFRVGEDTDLWIRMAMKHTMAMSAAVTVHYIRDNGGLMDQAQADMVSHQAPPPSPVFATIAALLADPSHASRHAALAAYGDGLRRRFAGQLIYNGHRQAARALLDGCRMKGPAWWLWRLAALVPSSAMRLAIRTRALLRG
ncbi:MAG: glycosyltransferase family 2 protein [Sphingomonadales bacterium]|nr:glycosyltransferase family 2 protein [Sphingomonadales bacterium]